MRKLKRLIVPGILTVAMLGMGNSSKENSVQNPEPNYIPISQIKPMAVELNGKPGLEGAITYKDKNYVLMEMDGKPVVTEYEVKGNRVILKQ